MIGFKNAVCAVVLGAVSLSGTVAQAQLIVSDIVEGSYAGGDVGIDNWFAQAFTMPSTSEPLGSVQLKLAREASYSGTFSVELWSSAQNGSPGSLITTLASGVDPATLTTTYSLYTYTPSAPLTLSGNSTYFVVMKGTTSNGESGIIWADTPTFDPVVQGPGGIGGWTRSNNLGNSWDSTVLSYPFQLAVYETVVPEPQTYALVAGLGLVCFAAFRRVRQRTA